MEYKNVNPLIGLVISSGKATLNELKTLYTLDDLYDLCEIIAIDRYNEYQFNQYLQKNNR